MPPLPNPMPTSTNCLHGRQRYKTASTLATLGISIPDYERLWTLSVVPKKTLR